MERSPTDVLSEILKAVRLEGALFFDGEFTAPWSIKSPRSADVVPVLLPGAGRLIIYHLLTAGRAYVQLNDGRRMVLAAGDVVVFPHGDPHILGNGSPEKPIEALDALADHFALGHKVARFGGGGESTQFVCGYMACEPRLGEAFLDGLPPMLIVNIRGDATGRWLEDAIRFSVDQDGVPGAGRSAVRARLSEVLFVETLRRYIHTLPPGQTGWLAGARDPAVGKALAHLHRNVAQVWTIATLARSVGVSRSLLAERFHNYLGEPPMAYLARWRLLLGSEMLTATDRSVAEIAGAVGYRSEAAFNRAFKRQFAAPPAQFRRMQARAAVT